MDSRREKDFGLKGVTPADFIVKTEPGTEPWGGIVQHVKTKQLGSFDDALEMTLMIQEKLDQVGFPQSATERRCWTSPNPDNRGTQTQPGPRREEMRDKKQKKTVPKGGPTFFIRIHYQQNTSWQGSVQWLEGKSTRFFRSHLELILLMQEAVDKSGGVEDRAAFQSWEDAEEIIS